MKRTCEQNWTGAIGNLPLTDCVVKVQGGGAPISGVSVSVTIGTRKKSATTAVSGAYTITDVPAGSYTVTPTKASYVLTPLTQVISVSSANVTGVNFNSYVLTGTLRTSTGKPISGVLMTLSGGGLTKSKTATTGTTGTYTIPGLGNGTYTLTPTKLGYTFPQLSVDINNADAIKDYGLQVRDISGSVTTGSGPPISAVTLTITIGITKKTATTAVNGTYTIADVPEGTYTVTPTKTGYVFIPASQSVTSGKPL